MAALFLAGAAYLWISSFRQQQPEGADAAREGGPPASFLRIAGTTFGVVFLAEWGDITQVTAANLAARYNPVAVFAGAVLGLWLIAALAVNLGAKSLISSPWPGYAASPRPSCWPSASTPPSAPSPANSPVRQVAFTAGRVVCSAGLSRG